MMLNTRTASFSLPTWSTALLGAVAVVALGGPAAAQSLVTGYTTPLPGGAQAGDLSPFQPCGFKGLPSRGESALCATFVVAEDPKKPKGRKISLPVVKLPAIGPSPREPIFSLAGGPGHTNLGFHLDAKTLFEEHDVYMLGYRGTDGPAELLVECPELKKAVVAFHPMTDGAPGMAAAARACAARLRAEGVDVRHYTPFDVVADNEALRLKLGLGKVDLMSQSYGTRISQFYTRLHPGSVKRVLMFEGNPPGHFQWFPEAFDDVLSEYARLCAQSPVCSKRTPDLKKAVLTMLANKEATYNGAPVDMEKARAVSQMVLDSKRTAQNIFDAAIAAEHGDYSLVARSVAMYDAVMPMSFVWGEAMSKSKGEIRPPRAAFLARRQPSATSFGSPLDLILFSAVEAWPDCPWPKGFQKAAKDPTPTLVVNGNLDTATPLRYTRAELMPFLPNGHLVVLSNAAHLDWDRDQPVAMNRLVGAWLHDGTVDSSGLVITPVPFH